jgi:hypothetical protein
VDDLEFLSEEELLAEFRKADIYATQEEREYFTGYRFEPQRHIAVPDSPESQVDTEARRLFAILQKKMEVL